VKLVFIHHDHDPAVDEIVVAIDRVGSLSRPRKAEQDGRDFESMALKESGAQ
jgi:hypothetical protein